MWGKGGGGEFTGACQAEKKHKNTKEIIAVIKECL